MVPQFSLADVSRFYFLSSSLLQFLDCLSVLLLGGTHSRLPSLASHTWGNQPPVSDDQHQPPLRWIIELPRKWSPGSVACIVACVFPCVQTFPGFLLWIVVSLPEFSESVLSWRELDLFSMPVPLNYQSPISPCTFVCSTLLVKTLNKRNRLWFFQVSRSFTVDHIMINI